MSDYRIVVQMEDGAGGSAARTPTEPSNEPATAPKPQRVVKTVSGVISAASNPVSAALGYATKAVPYLAAAALVVHAADRVATTAIGIAALTTGDTYNETAYSDFKNVFGVILNPVGGSISLLKQRLSIEKENKGIEASRALFGEASSNGSGVRGA